MYLSALVPAAYYSTRNPRWQANHTYTRPTRFPHCGHPKYNENGLCYDHCREGFFRGGTALRRHAVFHPFCMPLSHAWDMHCRMSLSLGQADLSSKEPRLTRTWAAGGLVAASSIHCYQHARHGCQELCSIVLWLSACTQHRAQQLGCHTPCTTPPRSTTITLTCVSNCIQACAKTTTRV
jgi:hypothetical protein